MTWFKVDDSFSSHPSAAAAGPAALGVWVMAGSWSAKHGTDGYLPRDVLPLFGATPDQVDTLVRVGLWRRARGGYRIVTELPAARGTRPLTLCAWERSDYRRKIPDGVRQLVYERDEFRCVECGRTEDLTLDHIHPWSRGGPDTPDNLRALCRTCNSSKGARI